MKSLGVVATTDCVNCTGNPKSDFVPFVPELLGFILVAGNGIKAAGADTSAMFFVVATLSKRVAFY